MFFELCLKKPIRKDERFSEEGDGDDVFIGPESEEILRHILECLKLHFDWYFAT